MEVSAAGYPTSYYAELLNSVVSSVSQTAIISTSSLGIMGSLLPGGIEPGMATVLVKVLATGACSSELAGWTLAVGLPDGGALTDGGYRLVYLGPTGIPDPSATATSKTGIGVVYDIDPSLSSFLVVEATNPDAGSCQVISDAAGFTGRVYVSGDAVSFDPVLLP
jgi:hypothetical protein